MSFGTFLDRQGNWIDTVHFPDTLAKYPFRGPGVYHIVGKVVVEYDFLSIEVKGMLKKALIEDPRYTEKRTIKAIETSNSRRDNWSRSNKDRDMTNRTAV